MPRHGASPKRPSPSESERPSPAQRQRRARGQRDQRRQQVATNSPASPSSAQQPVADAGTSLTPNAVLSLLRGGSSAPPSMPMTARLSDIRFCGPPPPGDSSTDCVGASARQFIQYFEATLTDGGGSSVQIKMSFHDQRFESARRSAESLVVSVNGFYSSSEKKPNVYLSNLDVLSGGDCCADSRTTAKEGTQRFQIQSTPRNGDSTNGSNERVQGGRSGTFLAETAPHLTDAELAGAHFEENEAAKSKRKSVDEAFTRHAAVVTLHSSRTSAAATTYPASTEPTSNVPISTICTVSTSRAYLSALKEFKDSQIDRQTAGLQSNVGRANAANASLLIEQHRLALDMALKHADTQQALTIDLLKIWHSTLCGGGLHPEAGRLRTKSVKAGSTYFGRPEDVKVALQKVVDGLSALEARMVGPRGGTFRVMASGSGSESIGPIVFAAAALFGVVDTHPFADGNGRLARIVANWALRRAGLPFPINILATPAQRKDYVSAIQATRAATNFCYHGEGEEEINGPACSSASSRLEALRSTGCLRPLVGLLTERIYRAHAELRREEVDKSNHVSAEAEASAARRARERAAQGDCIICLSERPNIATLCCGKAVHLNCIAEWLGANESCPQCRAEMPKLPDRAHPPAGTGEQQHGTTFHDDTTTTDETGAEGEDESESMEDTSVTEDAIDNTTDDTTDVAEDAIDEATNDTTDDTTDDTTHADGDPSASAEEDTTDDTSETSASGQSAASDNFRCALCANRRAVDCTNGTCGRCCVLHGSHCCERHNVA